MTMYQDFLKLALGELDHRYRGLGHSELDAALREHVAACRVALAAVRSGTDPSSAIAAQVNYNAALIRLGRARGIECDIAGFTGPKFARPTLEAALLVGGPGPASTAQAAAEPRAPSDLDRESPARV